MNRSERDALLAEAKAQEKDHERRVAMWMLEGAPHPRVDEMREERRYQEKRRRVELAERQSKRRFRAKSWGASGLRTPPRDARSMWHAAWRMARLAVKTGDASCNSRWLKRPEWIWAAFCGMPLQLEPPQVSIAKALTEIEERIRWLIQSDEWNEAHPRKRTAYCLSIKKDLLKVHEDAQRLARVRQNIVTLIATHIGGSR